ncbi:MAG TPA: class I SAM-dependent methyltransferase [Candidatus Acidoferrales bacterium]|nr:class I SAM-dependent methyltransferase [Candidatus Acidoferrales bacterium]
MPELEKAWLERYERWASAHAEDHRIAGWSEAGLKRRLALVLQRLSTLHLKPNSLVLDLGAGPGTYTRAISKIGHRCLGLDYSKKVIDAARRRGGNESYVQGEAYRLPFRRNAFDVVICIGVLQSLDRPLQALREINRVLVPDGHLMIDGLNRLFWLHRMRSWREKRIYRQERMRYYDPFALAREVESLGFGALRVSWLAVPEAVQGWLNAASAETGPLAASLFGHAFLLQGRKIEEVEKDPPHC